MVLEKYKWGRGKVVSCLLTVDLSEKWEPAYGIYRSFRELGWQRRDRRNVEYRVRAHKQT